MGQHGQVLRYNCLALLLLVGKILRVVAPDLLLKLELVLVAVDLIGLEQGMHFRNVVGGSVLPRNQLVLDLSEPVEHRVEGLTSPS